MGIKLKEINLTNKFKTMTEAFIAILFLILINKRFDKYFELISLFITQRTSTSRNKY